MWLLRRWNDFTGRKGKAKTAGREGRDRVGGNGREGMSLGTW